MTLPELKEEIQRLNAEQQKELLSFLTKELECRTKPASLAYWEARKRFENSYRYLFGTKYYWTGKDSGAIKQLLNKIAFKIKEVQPDYNDADVVNGFEHFIRKVYEISNDWLRQHFTLAIINQQFNALYTQIKNGKGNVSNSYKQKLVDDLNA